VDEKTIEEKQFFEEVEEDLKYKRLHALWSSYGRYLVIGLGLALSSSIAHLVWTDYEKSKMEKLTDHYMESLRSVENGDYEGALKQLDYLEGQGSHAFRTIIRLQKAYTLELVYDKTTGKENELKEKIYEAYASIQKDSHTPHFYKDMTSIIVAHGPFPEKHKPEIMANLEELSNASTRWHHLALEAMMVQYGIEKNFGKMREIATRLKDDMGVSKDILSRAQAVLERLDGDEIKQPAVVIPATPKGKEKK
jgi:hypothetical protein